MLGWDKQFDSIQGRGGGAEATARLGPAFRGRAKSNAQKVRHRSRRGVQPAQERRRGDGRLSGRDRCQKDGAEPSEVGGGLKSRLLVLALLLTGCGAKTRDYFPLKLGNKWTYEVTIDNDLEINQA